MTIQTDSRQTSEMLTDGAAKTFSFDFPVFNGVDGGKGVEVRFVNELGYDVVEPSDYLVIQDSDNTGGIVQFHLAPPTGKRLMIVGKTPLDQQLDITNYSRFHGESIETNFDKIVAICQEFVSKIDEETRQRINNDEALKSNLNSLFTQLATDIDARFEGKWIEIADYLNRTLPMFFCIMRKEIDAYAQTGLIDVINSELNNRGLSELIDEYINSLDGSFLTNTKYFSGAFEFDPDFVASGGKYPLNTQLRLTNGYIVKSTIDNNTNNPNVDMTGWAFSSLILTPFNFSAVGDGTSHKLSERYATLVAAQLVYPHAVSLDDEIDWCAIQKLNAFAIAANNPKIKIDWSGKFYTNRPIEYIVPASQIGQHRTIEGDIEIIPSVSFIGDDLVVIHGRGIQHKGVIKSNLQKRVKWGVQLAARGEPGAADYISFGNSVGKLFIDNAIIHAIRFTGNAMFGSVEFLRAVGCGVSSNYAGTTLNATVSNHVNSGGSLSSKSTVVVDVVPPVTPIETTILVKYGDFISRVTDVDAATNTLTIVPILPTIADTGVKLLYIFGGAVRTQGSDSAGGSIQKLTHIGCGIGVDHTAMYPLLVNQYLSEFAGVALYSGGLVGGLDIKQRYIEGDHAVLVQNCTRSSDGITNLDWGLNIDPKQIVDITFGRNEDGGTVSTYAGVRGLRLWNNGLSYIYREGKLPNNVIPNGVTNGFGVDFNAPFEHKIYKATGNMTVGFMPINIHYNRLFGLDSQEFTVFGTGLNGAPTGVITIPVLTGYTLNGGLTDLIFSGFNSAANFKFFLNVVAKNIQVSVSGVNTYNLSVSTQLPDGSNANTLDVNTKLWFRGATTATNLPTPTTGTKVDGNISTVYSVATLGTTHNKTQVVEYVSLFEKWERIYNSGSGSYGAWKLVSYEVKKGATAQRPTSPILGQKYYDTTLLASGKPIEWNGSSWIDMAGVVV